MVKFDKNGFRLSGKMKYQTVQLKRGALVSAADTLYAKFNFCIQNKHNTNKNKQTNKHENNSR